jgi:hypothetical protein
MNVQCSLHILERVKVDGMNVQCQLTSPLHHKNLERVKVAGHECAVQLTSPLYRHHAIFLEPLHTPPIVGVRAGHKNE